MILLKYGSAELTAGAIRTQIGECWRRQGYKQLTDGNYWASEKCSYIKLRDIKGNKGIDKTHHMW